MDEPIVSPQLATLRRWQKAHPFAITWHNMIQRCYNTKHPGYKDYGGRGILVCAEWRNDCAAFERWAESQERQLGWSLDRRDNNAGYSPDNCRYASSAVQLRNRRNNVLMTAFGETKTMMDWSLDKRCSTTIGALRWRIGRRMDHQEAITTPAVKKKKLSVSNVSEIVAIRKSRKQDAEIAARFGIHEDYIRKLVLQEKRKLLAHIHPVDPVVSNIDAPGSGIGDGDIATGPSAVAE